MATPAMSENVRIRLTVTFDVTERESFGGNAENLARCLVQYVTQADMPIVVDYGPNAFGGYDGAFITAAEARATILGKLSAQQSVTDRGVF